MRLLTIGVEYTGRLQLFGCGITSANLFESKIIELANKFGQQITHNCRLRGLECTRSRISKEMHEIFRDLHHEKVIIYYSGHGDHMAGLEFWQLPDGRIDQKNIATLVNEIEDNSLVYIFSESCSSEHMCNTHIATRKYVSIGATQDYEDAIMTCDGGVMTMNIVKIISSKSENFTLRSLWESMLESGVEIEHFSIRYSDEHLLDENVF